MLSITVTVAVQLAVFPLASVPVSVTVFTPTFVQLNVLFERLNVIPQLSVLPLSTSNVVIVAVPVASNATVTDLHNTTGANVSMIVTVVVHVDVFPLASTPVSVTVVVPMSAHVNELLDTLIITIPQLSVLPPSTWLAVNVAIPIASK